MQVRTSSFSPRNGEIILKERMRLLSISLDAFQSPQWGDNSKGGKPIQEAVTKRFSPRNGEIILKARAKRWWPTGTTFQSPQWGDNSKG